MKARLSVTIAGLAVAAVAASAAGATTGTTGSAASAATKPAAAAHANAAAAGAHVVAQPPGSDLGAAVTMTPPQMARLRAAATHAVSGPSTARRALSYSPNWGGEVITSTTPGTFQGVAGGWKVPTVQATTANKYSSTWVGVDGSGNSNLIQTGTEEDSIGGRTHYGAWWEILPAAETVITYSNGTPVPVVPGDSMWAYVAKTSTANVWTIYLQDITRNWSFTSNFYYYGKGQSAEWIEEATQVGGVVSPMPVFSKVTFTNLQVAEGGTWYYTALTNAKNGYDLRQNGHVYAYPGAPTGVNPQHFSVYHN